jgi:ankyrin repeat protein
MKKKLFFVLTVFVFLSPTIVNSMDMPSKNIQQLFDYASRNEWNKLEEALPLYEGSLNIPDSEGYTLLHRAVLANQEKSTSDLVAKGVLLDYSDLDKRPPIGTPLHYAAYKGYPRIAKILIDADTKNINSTNSEFKNTPLHLAAWANHPEIVTMLINAGALVSTPNALGSTPVHSASWRNSPASLRILLSYNPNVTQINGTGRGNTPLYLAAKAGSDDCLNLLLVYLKEKLENQTFTDYIDQECAADNSTAVQVAATRKNVQCYWNLALENANYYSKIKSGKKSYISAEIEGNNPVKLFVESIEKRGTENPPYIYTSNPTCLSCSEPYKKNDVIVKLNSCNHTFHTTCFQNQAVDIFFIENKNTPGMQYSLKNKSPEEVKHQILSSPLYRIDWNTIKQCPHCSKKTSIDKEAEIGIYFG